MVITFIVITKRKVVISFNYEASNFIKKRLP